MSNQYLKLRRSSVPGKVPSTSSIDLGEIALNTSDGLAYMKITGSYGERVIAIGSTGSFFGTASWATNSVTASYAPNYVLNSTFNSFTSSYNTGSFSGSFVGSFQGTSSWSQNSLTASYYSGVPATASWATNAITASSADDFLVRGTLTAQRIVVQTITASTEYVTGSTIFGSLLSNTHQFTGSVSITGSLTVTGAGITGSLNGTSSWSTNSLTASYAPNYVLNSATQSMLSPYVLSSQTGSGTVLSSSYAQTASYAPNYTLNSTFNSFTSSYNTGSFSGSFVGSFQGTSSFAATASFVTASNVYGPHGSNSVLSSSFSLTASYALNAGTTVNTGSFATTGSNTFKGTQIISGSVILPQLTAQTNKYVVSYDTASGQLYYQVTSSGGAGSGTPGGSSGQIQYNNAGAFDGVPSLTYVGGQLSATGSFSGSFTGSILGTASYANNAASSSYPLSVSGSTIYSNAFGSPISNFSATNGFFVGNQVAQRANLADNSTFIGYNAGFQAYTASNSTFIGYQAGYNADKANNSVFIGNVAGLSAGRANDSIFIGTEVGWYATSASNSNFLGPRAGYNAVNAYSSNFFGYQAGYGATAAYNSNFLNYQSGREAVSASNSNFFGYNAGYQAYTASNSMFVGYYAGYQASASSDSLFVGNSAGYQAYGANMSIFIGQNAGNLAYAANGSNFLGRLAGSNATNAQYSNFLGYQTGQSAAQAYYSNFLGGLAGYQAYSASYSNFFGYNAGYQASASNNAVFIGQSAGYQAYGANNSTFIGTSAGNGAVGAYDSIAIGRQSGQSATNAYQSVFLSYGAGLSATNAYFSNFIGALAGLNGTFANRSNFFGNSAGRDATNADNSQFIGDSAGNGATNAAQSVFIGTNAGSGGINSIRSTFLGYGAGSGVNEGPYSNIIGYYSGLAAYSASYSNIIGTYAGASAVSASFSTLIGYRVGFYSDTAAGAAGIKSNNIIIGANITLANGTSNGINIGGLLFGTGSYSTMSGLPSSGSANGKIGINQPNPQYSLDVSGSGNYTNGLTVTGSLKAPSITGSLQGTSSWSTYAVTASYFSGSISSSINSLTASYVNPLRQTVEITGSLNISGSTTQIGNNTLLGNTLLSGSITVSGSFPPGGISASLNIYGNTTHDGYIRFNPVSTNLDNSVSASYIYVSGSTNDLYFSQNGAGYSNTTRLRWLEGNLYTGLLNGGLITTASSTTFNISSGSGIVVNLNASLTTNPYPTITYVNWGNLTNQSLTYRTTNIQTFVGIDSNGGIVQQTTPWNDGQYNTSISLGTVLHQNLSTINGTITYPNVAYGYKQRTYDFIKAFGPLKLSGLNILPSGSKGVTIGIGTAWADGRNYQVDPNNPSYIIDSGTSVSKIFRYYQSASTFVQDTNGGVGYTEFDTDNYNPGNSGSLVTTSTTKFSIQRLFWYPNSVTKAVVAYYGSTQYDSMNEAIQNINIETFNETPNTQQNAVYLGSIVWRGRQNYGSANGYTIVPGGIFRSIGGSGGGGSVVTTRLSDLSDVTIATPTDGQALVYDTVLQKWKNASDISASISGNAATATLATNASTASYAPNYALNSTTASFATTGSNTFKGTQIISGSVILPQLTSQINKYIVSYDTASGQLYYQVTSSAGGSSTNPGGSTGQIQYNNAGAFDGVPNLTYVGGQLSATGSFSGSFTGSFYGTASWAQNTLSSSLSYNSYTASTVNYLTESAGSTAEYSIIRANDNKYVLTTYESSTALADHLYISTRNLNWTGSSVASRSTAQIIAIGSQALQYANADGGSRNGVAIGAAALRNLRAGAYNVGIGVWALEYLTNGERNVAIGEDAGGGITTGSYNTYLGAEAGYGNNQVTASHTNVIALGYRALFSSQPVPLTNTTVIGTSLNTSLNNVVLLGRADQNVLLGALTTDNGARLQVSGAISASAAITAPSFTGSFYGTASWAENALTSSYILNAISASYASTASSADDFLVRGTLTAQRIVVQTITSSTDYVTGSTRFGSLQSNTHQFTGSVSITGSLNVVGSGITSSLFGTSSWATNALTASFAPNIYNSNGFLTSSRVVNQTTYDLTFSGSTGQIIIQNSPSTNAGNVLVIKNTSNSVLNGFATLGLDTNTPGGMVDIKLASATPSGIRMYASNDVLGISPAGAGFQFYSTSSLYFPGHVYFDTAAHDSAEMHFRTAGSNTAISSRIVIDANGTINLYNNTVANAIDTNVLTMGGTDGSYQSTTNTTIEFGGPNTLISVLTGSYTSMFVDYTVNSGSNARAGNVMAVWNGSNIQYTENSTLDIGATSDVTMSVSLFDSAGDWYIQLIGSSTLYDWNVKTTYRLI